MLKRKRLVSILVVLMLLLGVISSVGQFAYAEEGEAECSITVDGGKAYIDGAEVATAKAEELIRIEADKAPDGMVFDKWEVIKGNVEISPELYSENGAISEFRMPNEEVEIKAHYRRLNSEKVDLVLDLTECEIEVPANDLRNYVVPILREAGKITLGVPPYGYFIEGDYHRVFRRIDCRNETHGIENAKKDTYAYGIEYDIRSNVDNISYTLTDEDYARFKAEGKEQYLEIRSVSIKFKNETEYSITVDGGKAYKGDKEVEKAREGDKVILLPNHIPDGMIFDHWEVAESENINIAYASFIMPEGDVSIKAIYRKQNEPADLVIDLSNGAVDVKKDDPRNEIIDILAELNLIRSAGGGVKEFGRPGLEFGYRNPEGTIYLLSRLNVHNEDVYVYTPGKHVSESDNIYYTLTDQDHANFKAKGYERYSKIRSVALIFKKSKEEPKSYEIKKGANSTWKKDGNEGLLISSDGPFAEFVEVRINGSVLAPENYDAKEGSTEITLKSAYLETLSAGKYNMEIVHRNGSASTVFEIKTAANNNTTEPTANDGKDTNTNEAGKPDNAKDKSADSNEKPQAKETSAAPNTGDESGMVIYSIMMLAAALAVCVSSRIVISYKKNR